MEETLFIRFLYDFLPPEVPGPNSKLSFCDFDCTGIVSSEKKIIKKNLMRERTKKGKFKWEVQLIKNEDKKY